MNGACNIDYRSFTHMFIHLQGYETLFIGLSQRRTGGPRVTPDRRPLAIKYEKLFVNLLLVTTN
jgi:hypothetical protein